MVYGYARVSTTHQAKDGNSLDSQRTALTDAGAETIYEEHISGTKMDRPQLQLLLTKLQKGDKLIATKLDRIARSASAGADLIKELQARGVVIHILNMGVLDATTVGRLITNLMFAFAEFERDMIVERTSEGKAVASQRVDFVDGRPPAYTDAQIAHALQLLSEGNSYSKVAELTRISKSTLTRAKRKYKDDKGA